MPRKSARASTPTDITENTAAPAGHNKPPLTEDEAGALTTYYELKIREDQRKVEALMVDLKSARGVVNGHFKRMTADLGFSRKEFEAEVIDKADMSEAEYLSAEPDEADPDAEARKLKASGWAEPTGEETEFADA